MPSNDALVLPFCFGSIIAALGVFRLFWYIKDNYKVISTKKEEPLLTNREKENNSYRRAQGVIASIRAMKVIETENSDIKFHFLGNIAQGAEEALGYMDIKDGVPKKFSSSIVHSMKYYEAERLFNSGVETVLKRQGSLTDSMNIFNSDRNKNSYFNVVSDLQVIYVSAVYAMCAYEVLKSKQKTEIYE